MREHIRINHTHRDRKPYQCGYCDFRAHTSGNCRKHCVSRHKGTLIKLYPREHKMPISMRKQGQYMTINNLIFRASALSALFERFNGLFLYLWKLILFDFHLLYFDEKISVLKLHFFLIRSRDKVDQSYRQVWWQIAMSLEYQQCSKIIGKVHICKFNQNYKTIFKELFAKMRNAFVK